MTAAHVTDQLLAGWASDGLPDVAAWSVETHLSECPRCRARLEDLPHPATDDRLEATFRRVRATIASPPRSRPERALSGLGIPESTVRLLVATRSFTWPWLLGVAFVAAATLLWASQVGANPLSDDPGWTGAGVFLAVTPLVPLAGVALAFGPRTDPTHALLRAAPYSAGRLLLVRSLAVLATTLPVMVIAAVATPAIGLAAGAAVLPSLAVLATALAMTTRWSTITAVTVPALGWGATVQAMVLVANDPVLALGTTIAQVGCAVLAAIGIAVVYARLPRVDVVA